ncbi:MAG: hypothetical protein J0L50_13620 [Sphingomonadales bacterium]|nr:hypothetical protein [Sphingomonadales bacterium]
MKIALAGLGAAAVAVLAASVSVSPAIAQGQNTTSVEKVGICPVDWHEGGTRPGQAGVRGRCYPDSSVAPKVYLRASTSEPCAAGYNPSERYCTTKQSTQTSAEIRASGGPKLTKPAPNARCPLGWASTRDLATCYTTIENPSVARLKNGKACAAGELDEWGIWCTSNYKHIPKNRAEAHGNKDFNEVYGWTMRNRGDTKAVGDTFSPAAEAWFASNSGAAASSAAPATTSTQAQTESKPANCESGAVAGAVVGGVVGGKSGARTGAVLGGGLGKKKGC